MTKHIDPVVSAKTLHEGWLRQQQGVEGIGIGFDTSARPCIRIYTRQMPANVRSAIEDRLNQVNVEFEEIGNIRKQ
jgi:hypothetical protein